MKIRIGDTIFPTKKAAKDAVKAILYTGTVGRTLDGVEHVFACDLFARHPRYEQKVPAGSTVHHFVLCACPRGTASRRLDVVFSNGDRADFSYLKCIDGESQRRLVMQACREAVHPSVRAAKLRLLRAGDVPSELHADHAPPWPFVDIVDAWLAHTDRTVDDISTTPTGSGIGSVLQEGDVASFVAFHDARAVIRLLSAHENLSRGARR